MNILFLTISGFRDLNSSSIYLDLLKKLKSCGHNICVACPLERRLKEETRRSVEADMDILRIKTGNITKVNLIEKGISTILLESQFKSAIKKHFKDVRFDLILYSTPPITFANVIKYFKKRDNAKTYLLLKDIFPQNAVDMRMFSKKSIIYKFFRHKEKELYKISDRIGCMSQANVDYVIKNNPYINKEIVHVSPNSIEFAPKTVSDERKLELRKKYGVPLDKKVFIYGGNLGKPQGIPFLIECLRKNMNKADQFFVVCGRGTEFSKLKNFVDTEKPENVLLINGLPKEEYEDFVPSCDVGLIFLDHRFTIPNFPSRLLSYMRNGMPVIAATDPNTDIGKVIEGGGFGWWCESNDADEFTRLVDAACEENLTLMGEKAVKYLIENYTAQKSCEIIVGDKNNGII